MSVSKPRFWKGRNAVCANTVWDQKNGAPEPRFGKGRGHDVLWTLSLSADGKAQKVAAQRH